MEPVVPDLKNNEIGTGWRYLEGKVRGLSQLCPSDAPGLASSFTLMGFYVPNKKRKRSTTQFPGIVIARNDSDEAISGWVSEGLLRSPEATLLTDSVERLAVARWSTLSTFARNDRQPTPILRVLIAALQFLTLPDKRRQGFFVVCNNTEICHLKYLGVAVPVYGHNALGY